MVRADPKAGKCEFGKEGGPEHFVVTEGLRETFSSRNIYLSMSSLNTIKVRCFVEFPNFKKPFKRTKPYQKKEIWAVKEINKILDNALADEIKMEEAKEMISKTFKHQQ